MTKPKYFVFEIFLESMGLYCSNILNFMRYMFFPVFGQLIGLGLCLALNSLFINNLDFLQKLIPALKALKYNILIIILITLPCLILFLTAFWKYLLAYASLNSMVKNMLKSGRIYDFEAHEQVVQNRLFEFITLWVFLSLFLIIFSSPLLWVLGLAILVFFILIFQLFIFEPKLTPVNCFKRSFKLIKPYYFESLFLIILIGILSFFLIPEILIFLLKLSRILEILIIPVDFFTVKLPITQWNLTLAQMNVPFHITSLQIAKLILNFTISFIAIGLTLPFRSICCVLWYNFLKKEEKKLYKKKGKK